MKRAVFTLTFLFFSFLLIPNSSAISISPGQIKMDFIPNLELDFQGMVSGGSGGMEIDILVEGDLKDYITLLTPEYVVLGPDQVHTYRFSIKMPPEFDRPGDHISIIWAAQHVEGGAEGSAVAKLRVGTIVKVVVPYPGKYAVARLKIENPEVGENVLFGVDVTNLGKENITSAKAEIKLMDIENNTIVILQTEGKPIETTKTETFQATWFSDTEPGLYKADVKVTYDGKEAYDSKMFNLGAPLIKIVEIVAEPIENGTIGKINTKVQSFWNQEIRDVYIEMFVKDSEGRTVAEGKSESTAVGMFSTPVITNYWDTTNGVEIGNYTGLFVLKYLDKNDTKEAVLEVMAKPGALSLDIIAIIAAVIVIAIGVGVFLLFGRGKGRYRQKKLM